MVAVKGRMNLFTRQANQEGKMSDRGRVKNFKIYAEVDKVDIPNSLNNVTKNAFDSDRCLVDGSDLKSDIKVSRKSEIKQHKSVKILVGRKVLGDISNVKGSFPRSGNGTFLKLGSNKSKGMLDPQRYTTGGNTEATLSDKTSTGRVRLDRIHATTENFTLKNTAYRNIKTTLNEPQTKFQDSNSATGRESGTQCKVEPGSRRSLKGRLGLDHSQAASKKSIPRNNKATFSDIKFQGRSSTTGRISVRNPLHMTRKSLPVSKQTIQVEKSDAAKGNSEKLMKSVGKKGFPVKSSGQRSILPPKPSNCNSRPWRNGVRNVASRAECKVVPGTSSQNSVKPTMITRSTTLKTQKHSQTSHQIDLKKLRSSPAVLSKKKQSKVFLPIDISFIGISAPEKVISGDTNNVGSTSVDVSDRRNSYTSSLLSRSKECSNVISPETLPNIYDDRNHLEVSEYVDDIYLYYWVMEGHNPLMKNYMETQGDITPQMRGILINWLIEVNLKFDLMEETLFLTVILFDRYLSLERIKKNELQLVGLTALLLASKYEDFWHPRVSDLVSISAESYTRDQMLQMEKKILKKLKFRLNEPTPYVFMLRFLKAAQSDIKVEHLAFYLIELCLVEYEALNYQPSLLCASAVYVARCTMQITPAWSPLLAKHARYQESNIRGCAEMILKFHKAAKTSLLKVTYEKYMNVKRHRVATIKPLSRLPK